MVISENPSLCCPIFPSPMSSSHSENCLSSSLLAYWGAVDSNLMFFVSLRIWQWSQMYDAFIVAWTMSEWLPFGTIGQICRKSPPKTIIFPPKGTLFCMMSLRLLSSALNANLWHIGASSQTISFVTFNNSANSLPWWILHVEFCVAGTGIANLECVIWPPG